MAHGDLGRDFEQPARGGRQREPGQCGGRYAIERSGDAAFAQYDLVIIPEKALDARASDCRKPTVKTTRMRTCVMGHMWKMSKA